jgi:hypothetical protein
MHEFQCPMPICGARGIKRSEPWVKKEETESEISEPCIKVEELKNRDEASF